MKTAKYQMDVKTFNTGFPQPIDIPKKKYEAMLKHFRQVAKTTQEGHNMDDPDSWEYIVKIDTKITEKEKTIVTENKVADGSTYIYLTEIRCKEGYCFT